MKNSESNEVVLECLEEVCGPATDVELGLAPHYRLLEALRDSPQGRQFLVEDLRQQRRASLLVLSQEFASDGPQLAALRDAVEQVRQAPHRRLREVYGLETARGDTVLVEEHARGHPYWRSCGPAAPSARRKWSGC
jgi:hypothetical protein